MQQIILTEEQMTIVSQARDEIQVCDSRGNVLGTVISPQFLAEMKRRAAAPGPRYSSEQVQHHMRALQEAWDREGPFDQVRMHEILAKIRESEK